MKISKAKNKVVGMLLIVASSAHSNCIFEGKSYEPFTGPQAFISKEWSEDSAKGYPIDGYALVITCTPVIDTGKLSNGNWSISDIPKSNYAWTIKKP